MRRTGLTEMWRGGLGRSSLERSRGFGGPAPTLAQRLVGVVSPESLFRLILAFVLATALWLYVTSRNAPDAAFSYPRPIAISPEFVSNGLTVRGQLPSVHVNVRAVFAGVTISPASFVATVDLRGFKAGVYRHVPVHLSSGSSVSVVSYSPRTVAVVLEHVMSKQVPVDIQLLSAPPFGYAVAGNLLASPPNVQVAGPRSFVNQVERAVIALSLAGDRSSLNLSYTPVLENGQGSPLPNHVTVSPPRVRVHAVIQQLASFKTLPILATIQGEPSPGFGVTAIRVSPPGLTAYGSPHSLSALQNLRTAVVQVGGLTGGRKKFRARLRVPRGVYFHTRFVRVTVTVGPVTGAASTHAPVVPVGVSAGDVVQSQPGSILVTLSGPSPRLRAAGAHIQAQVNVSGLGLGTYTLTPHIVSPSGIHVETMEPSNVTVTIRSG